MPERAREIAFQIRAQSPAPAQPAPLTDSRAALRCGRARTPRSSPALVTSRYNFDNFVTESKISPGDVIINRSIVLCSKYKWCSHGEVFCVLSAPDCKGEDAEDTFTGLKVLKHSYGELLNKGLDLNSMKR